MGFMEFVNSNKKNVIRGAIVFGGVLLGLLLVGAKNNDEGESINNGDLIVVETTEVSTQENETV